MTDTASKVCPLCYSTDCREIAESLNGQDLRALWKELGQELSAQAWGPLSEQTLVSLLACHRCGFEFFDPALAGNATFYEELDHPNYYTPNRPEFERSLSFARKHGLARVLDVGCGTGAFLDLAKRTGLETYGLELNQAAAEKARGKGHTIFESLLDKIPPENPGFDLITLFQVLEHVAMPAEVIRTASSLLRPGGFLAISVPGAEGISRIVPLDPHQWPPHHVSRWRLKDFRQLANETGLVLFESGGDVLFGSDVEAKLLLQNRLSRSLGRRSKPNAESFAKIVSLIYRKTGMKYLLPHWGTSIHTILERPNE